MKIITQPYESHLGIQGSTNEQITREHMQVRLSQESQFLLITEKEQTLPKITIFD